MKHPWCSTPKRNAAEYQRFYKAWGEDGVDLETAARELDPLLTPKALAQAIRRYSPPTNHRHPPSSDAL